LRMASLAARLEDTGRLVRYSSMEPCACMHCHHLVVGDQIISFTDSSKIP
jgi:hypothetical protein